MRKLLIALAAALALISPAKAADSTLPALTAANAFAGTDLLYIVQSGATIERKGTPLQMAAYVYGLMSGDATASGTGALTLATVNSNVGTFGSATSCITTTQNAKGLTTAISAATCTPAIGSITGLGTGVQAALAAAMNSSTGPVGALTPTNNNCIVGNGSAWTSTTCPGGGGGTPGGSTTQVQYNNAGSFGGITGATTNGTALTLVAPVLGTPASGTLTNTTGFPLANLAGAGTGVLSAGAASLNASTGLVGALTATNGNCVVGNGSAWTSTACPGGTAANPTGTAGPTAVNGVATTYMRSDGAPAVQTGTTGQLGLLQPDGTTITVSSGIISTAPQSVAINLQTGTNYPIVSGDRAKAVYLSNASPQVPTLPTAASVGANWFASVCNIGAGTQTITPTTSTIGGASTFVLPAASAARPACFSVLSDGTNYSVYPDFPMDASMFSAGTLAVGRGGTGITSFGTGVATALGNNVSAAGGLTTTIGSGTATLGTSAITSGSCATVVTVATANVATTDVISFTPNADITAVTGYAPVTTGGLAIYPYPTSGNANFKVCNPTSSSITPGAVTLNFRVTR